MSAVPRLLSLSPPDPGGASMWVGGAPGLVEAAADGLLLRLLAERESAVPAWLDDLEDTGVVVIVHARTPGAATEVAGRGVGLHLPSGVDPAPWRSRVRGLLGQSCHDLAELQRAATVCDYATLSPVWAPRSKGLAPGQAAIGLVGFQRLVAAVDLPVLAMGGIGPGRVTPCLAAGAWGVAGIGAFGDARVVGELAAELGRVG